MQSPKFFGLFYFLPKNETKHFLLCLYIREKDFRGEKEILRNKIKKSI